MAMPPSSTSELRAVNARIAAAYDMMPFDSDAIPGIDPARALGVGALYGAGPAQAAFDVLDLGCGTGVHLARLAGLTSGRLIGTDLSASACAAARARCAAFGARVEIMCEDFLDLTPQRLGPVDLIYNIGVLYVTPPEVQRHILALIAGSLKPNGVALLSYYAGTTPLLMTGLQPVLRLAAAEATAPAEQIRAARARLAEMISMLSRQGGDHRAVLETLRQVQARNDPTFFHEMLSPHFTALTTSGLEARLAAEGVHFLNALTPYPVPALASPAERAMLADTADFAGGSYRYAVFAKCAGIGLARIAAPQVRWVSRLKPVNAGANMFRDEQGASFTITHPATTTALAVLAQSPASWSAFAGSSPDATLEQDIRQLSQLGLLIPEWHRP